MHDCINNILNFARIKVKYHIEYSDTDCSTATSPDPVSVEVRSGATVYHIMERAEAEFGSPYRFTSHYDEGLHGYMIDSINGTKSTYEDNNCSWYLYIRDPQGEENFSHKGVSICHIPSDGYSVIWRFCKRLD